jgi:hypothetical protein
MRIAALAACLLAGCVTVPELYVLKAGPGEGRIVSDPAGIDCGNDCERVGSGPIMLTARPATNSLFVGWSGLDECAADPVCSFTVVDDTRVEARFERFQPTLTVTPAANVWVHASGIDCGADCTETYDYGTSVTLSVTTQPGWVVTGWTGVDCPDAACTLTLTEDTIATPIVASASTLHVTVVDYVDGTKRVKSSPMGIDCGGGSSKCETAVATGEVVTLTASSFGVQWSGCMTIPTNTNTCVVQVSGALNVEATFR